MLAFDFELELNSMLDFIISKNFVRNIVTFFNSQFWRCVDLILVYYFFFFKRFFNQNYILCVFGQFLLRGKKFRSFDLLQIPMSFVFSKVINLFNDIIVLFWLNNLQIFIIDNNNSCCDNSIKHLKKHNIFLFKYN